MKYTNEVHHRRSIRLKGYDYSQAGLYFLTICVQNHECLFGTIRGGEMVLNDAGKMIEKWCVELSHKFSDIVVDTHIVMPNHFHAVIVNNGCGNTANTNATASATPPVGADLCVCPNDFNRDIMGERPIITGEHVGGDILGEHIGSPLHRVVQWF